MKGATNFRAWWREFFFLPSLVLLEMEDRNEDEKIVGGVLFLEE